MKIVNYVDSIVDWLNNNPFKTIFIMVVLFLFFKK
jgi:hypothetical protein